MSVTAALIIFTIVLILLVYYANTEDKRSKKERMGDAVSDLAQDVANSVSFAAQTLTEPEDKKKLRLARKELSSRLSSIYWTHVGNIRESFDHNTQLNQSFKEQLKTLGITEETWKELTTFVLYISQIRYLSRDYNDYSKRNSRMDREEYLKDDAFYGLYKEKSEIVKEGLESFGIPLEEWLEYGDAILEMHNITDNELWRQYGCYIALSRFGNNQLSL